MTDIELQRRADRLVSQEVNCCLSSLVFTLAKSNGSIDRNERDLSGLVEQAAELSYPVLDYESAARDAGWHPNVKNDDSRVTRSSKRHQGGVFASDWQAACEQDNIEPHECEVYEHWAVSPWLAEKLDAKGERVDTDFAGLSVWARTTTGQAIAADAVILAIVQDLDAA